MMGASEYRKTDHRFPDGVVRFLALMLARTVLEWLVIGAVVVAVVWEAMWAASSAEARAASWDATTTALLDAIEEEYA